MAQGYIEERMAMYRKVLHFSDTFHEELLTKHVLSLNHRLEEHATDLAALTALYEECSLPGNADILDKVNLRLQELKLASEIVHKLVFAHYGSPNSNAPEVILAGMYATKASQDLVFYNQVRMMLKGVEKDPDKEKVPAELLNQLNEVNSRFKDLVENQGTGRDGEIQKGTDLFRTVEIMEDRLHILDRLMDNYKQSNPEMYHAYMCARDPVWCEQHTMPYYVFGNRDSGRALKS